MDPLLPESEEETLEESNQGNRENLINTISRVCSRDFVAGTIEVNDEYNEVTLQAPVVQIRRTKGADSWVLDDSFDSVPPVMREYDSSPGSVKSGYSTPNRRVNSSKSKFASQLHVWGKIKHWLQRRIADSARRIALLALGGHGSGKSYTLFGNNNIDDMGIVPRTLELLFEK